MKAYLEVGKGLDADKLDAEAVKALKGAGEKLSRDKDVALRDACNQHIIIGNINDIRTELISIQVKLDKLEQYLSRWLQDTQKDEFVRNVNGCLLLSSLTTPPRK